MARSRDEAWHAVLVTAHRADDTFRAADVQEVAADLGLEVADRTLRRTIGAMVDFGYLRREKHGVYEPSRPWTAREFVDAGEEVADVR